MVTDGANTMQTAWLTVTDRNALEFQVKACADARVVLSRYIQIRQASSYEFLIGHGDPQTTSLWKGGEKVRKCLLLILPKVLTSARSEA